MSLINRETTYAVVFYKYPLVFNTLINNTQTGWGQDAMYLLGNGGTRMTTTANQQYYLCQMKVGLTPYCSTYYTAQSIGGQMQAHCNDPNEQMTYINGNKSRTTTVSQDWFDVAGVAITALSFNNGIMDGNASNARLLSELMLQKLELNQALPSPAEALAVLGSASILASVQDSPFVEFWVRPLPKLRQRADRSRTIPAPQSPACTRPLTRASARRSSRQAAPRTPSACSPSY